MSYDDDRGLYLDISPRLMADLTGLCHFRRSLLWHLSEFLDESSSGGSDSPANQTEGHARDGLKVDRLEGHPRASLGGARGSEQTDHEMAARERFAAPRDRPAIAGHTMNAMINGYTAPDPSGTRDCLRNRQPAIPDHAMHGSRGPHEAARGGLAGG